MIVYLKSYIKVVEQSDSFDELIRLSRRLHFSEKIFHISRGRFSMGFKCTDGKIGFVRNRTWSLCHYLAGKVLELLSILLDSFF